jgi:hypothetical protein
MGRAFQNGVVGQVYGGTMDSYNVKVAIAEDVKNLDLALIILNGLRDTNMARLTLLTEAEKREH